MFSGLREDNDENTEAKLRDFLSNELGINQVELGNVHRFGKFVRGKHRPIVARFLYSQERSNILSNARKLKGTFFYINEQFPSEIEEKRRSLYPKLKELRRSGHRAKLVRDRLIVDGRLYTDDAAIVDGRESGGVPKERVRSNDVASGGRAATNNDSSSRSSYSDIATPIHTESRATTSGFSSHRVTPPAKRGRFTSRHPRSNHSPQPVLSEEETYVKTV